MSERARRTLLTADGVFLAVIGSVQVLLEVAAYYAGAGPYGEVARKDLHRFWHVFAAAVHVLLGGANIVFWDSFGAFGMVPMGVAATVVHAVFVALHAAALVRRAQPAASYAGPK